MMRVEQMANVIGNCAGCGKYTIQKIIVRSSGNEYRCKCTECKTENIILLLQYDLPSTDKTYDGT